MKCMPNNSMFLAGFCILAIAINTIFVQFVHYDSQYRFLNPRHYNVDVITQEDYGQLLSYENRPVKLSTGKTVTERTQAYYSRVLPKYKAVTDGSRYVLVTLRGTAPFISQWYSGVLPILVPCIFVLLIGIKGRKQVTKEPDIAASEDRSQEGE